MYVLSTETNRYHFLVMMWQENIERLFGINVVVALFYLCLCSSMFLRVFGSNMLIAVGLTLFPQLHLDCLIDLTDHDLKRKNLR